MKNSGRQIVKIIKEICAERNIPLKLFSYDWIMQMKLGGKNVFIYGYQFSNNNAASQLICGDKSALSDVLLENGIDAVEHSFFMSPGNMHYIGADGSWKALIELLDAHKTLVLKKNDGTGGNNIYKVTNQVELENAAHNIYKVSGAMSVSPYYEIENEYRVIVLNGNVELIYLKEIPYITGDGIRTLGELFAAKYGFGEINTDMDFDSGFIVPSGEKVKLNWKHNLGKGAVAKTVCDEAVIRELSGLAVSAAKAADIAFASIDIIRTSGKLKVLEINSGIMVEFFSRQSAENYEIAKSIYAKALDALTP